MKIKGCGAAGVGSWKGCIYPDCIVVHVLQDRDNVPVQGTMYVRFRIMVCHLDWLELELILTEYVVCPPMYSRVLVLLDPGNGDSACLSDSFHILKLNYY